MPNCCRAFSQVLWETFLQIKILVPSSLGNMSPNQNSVNLRTLALSSLIICDYLSLFQFSSMESSCIAHTVSQLPPGFELKFKPTPEILVCDYLRLKILGEQLPCTAAVKECDLYGSKKPDQIWEELGGLALGKGEDVFFFTTLTKTNRNFKRKNDFGGTWTGKGGEKVFSGNVNEEKKPIARCRRLVYAPPKREEEEPPQEKSELEHCGWTVFEYTVDVEDSELAEDLLKCPSYSTQVVCQLRKQEQNHHETTTTGKRKRHDFVNQDSHTDAGDPSDSIFNQLSSVIENWEVQNFNIGGGVPPGLNYTQPSDPSLEHDREWNFDFSYTLDEWTVMLDQLDINQDSHTDAGDPSDPDYNQLPQSHSITDDVVSPSQMVSNSQHNWGTYPFPPGFWDISDIPDIGDSMLEVSKEEYFRSNPSCIPDPEEAEI